MFEILDTEVDVCGRDSVVDGIVFCNVIFNEVLVASTLELGVKVVNWKVDLNGSKGDNVCDGNKVVVVVDKEFSIVKVAGGVWTAQSCFQHICSDVRLGCVCALSSLNGTANDAVVLLSERSVGNTWTPVSTSLQAEAGNVNTAPANAAISRTGMNW